MKTREDLNSAYYGAIVTPTDILLKRSVANPESGRLIEVVSKLAGTYRPSDDAGSKGDAARPTDGSKDDQTGAAPE